MPAQTNVTTFLISGKEYEFDPDDLELGEMDFIESELGCVLSDVDWRRAKAAICVAYVILRRENPNITLDEVSKLRNADFTEKNGKPAPPTRRKRAPQSSG